MIRISNLIHKGLVNINTDESLSVESSELNNMTFGNKIALLCGDYLLSNSCTELASLRNQDVSIYIFIIFLAYIDFLFKCINYKKKKREEENATFYFFII